MEDINTYNKLYKEALEDLKTSVWSLKFSPDHLSAVVHFTDAAKGYKKLGKWNESLKAFDQAIQCNKKLHESWAEGQNWKEMAEIYTLELNNIDKGIECIKNACLAIKIAGKVHSGIKILIEFADKNLEKNNTDVALKMLHEAYNETIEYLHEEIVRVGLDDIVGKIIDIFCGKEMFKEAIVFIDKLINIQKGITGEKKYKITKNYIKLGMLMIINNEAYMVDGIVNNMFSIYDGSCGDDIEDLKALYKAYTEVNKQKFNNLITYSFSLFQNNLLKAIKKSFDAKAALVIDRPPVIDLPRDELNVDLNETKDTFITKEEEVVRDPTDEYL